MRIATLLLFMVLTTYNVTYYTVLIHKDIYSLAWAPNVFLISWLLLLAESKHSLKSRLVSAFSVCIIALPGGNLFFSWIFTRTLSGIDGYLVNDILFVTISFGTLLILKNLNQDSLTSVKTHTQYLLTYIKLISAGISVTFLSAIPAGVIGQLSGKELQQLFLGGLLAFFLYGVPVFFSWMNRFNFHLRLYQGQAILSTLMVLSVFILPDISTNTFNWFLWGGMFLTLLWRSAWCQVIVFGLWGPLITQEFALKDKSLTDYGSMLLVIISTQILWLLFLHGDLLYESLKRKIEKQDKALNTDPLTDCLNRRGFFNMCNALLQKGQELSIGILDINRFKAINDSLGHEAGDVVLQIVANRLAGCMGGKERISRIGGDEFAFVVSGSEALMRQKCQLFFSQLSERPIIISGQILYIGVSLGYSCSPRDGILSEHLLHRADIAMYIAKRQRLQESVTYEPSMNITTTEVSGTAFSPISRQV